METQWIFISLIFIFKKNISILLPHLDKCWQYQLQFAGTRVFGVPLSSLVSKDRKVPLIVERLIAIVELHGMYTEGLYRRAGAQAKVKLLKQLMDSGKEGTFNKCLLVTI